MSTKKIISPQVINRLPKYHRCVTKLSRHGFDRVSSAQIARLLGTTPSQVRQDFSVFGNYGSQGYGYGVQSLLYEIENIIGINKQHEIAVIGVGCIGKALLEHLEFERFGYHVAAAFDNNPRMIGAQVNGVCVYDVNHLPTFLEENEIDICILSVSKTAAKRIAYDLYRLGVEAIWNFTNEDLELNDNEVVVQNLSFMDSLFILTYYLREKRSGL